MKPGEGKPGSAPTPGPRTEVQQLWFSTLQRQWSSLVVMPVDPGGSALALAAELVNAGRLAGEKRLRLVDAEEKDLSAASSLIVDLVSWVHAGEKVVVCTRSPLASQLGIPLATAADGVLLTVTLGRTPTASVKRTVQLLGKERILGCVAMRPASRG